MHFLHSHLRAVLICILVKLPSVKGYSTISKACFVSWHERQSDLTNVLLDGTVIEKQDPEQTLRLTEMKGPSSMENCWEIFLIWHGFFDGTCVFNLKTVVDLDFLWNTFCVLHIAMKMNAI